MYKITDKINALIASHGVWKMRLRHAICGDISETGLSTLTSWRKSEFGKWLIQEKPRLENQPEYQEVYRLYLQVHVEAARAVTLALNGQVKEASKEIASGSKFATLSARLISVMINWRESLEKSAKSQPVLQWLG